jgi:hypothetical protein
MPGAGNSANSQQAYEVDPDYNEQERDIPEDVEEDEDDGVGKPSSRGRGSPHDRFKEVLSQTPRQVYALFGIILPEVLTDEQV